MGSALESRLFLGFAYDELPARTTIMPKFQLSVVRFYGTGTAELKRTGCAQPLLSEQRITTRWHSHDSLRLAAGVSCKQDVMLKRPNDQAQGISIVLLPVLSAKAARRCANQNSGGCSIVLRPTLISQMLLPFSSMARGFGSTTTSCCAA